MMEGEGTVTPINPVRLLGALGMLFVVAGAVQAGLLVANARPLEGVIIDFILIGGPGLGLLYGTRALSRSSIEPAVYQRVVLWVTGGLAVMLVALGLLMVNPGGEITRPLRAAAMAAGFGAVGGFPIGVNEARAITRAREAEQRNRALERTQAKLEETVDQLEESNDRLEESNERLEQFAYAASHDLQEPLRMVSSYLQLIERRYADELDEDGREFIEFAVDGADRMREMIDGLLAYSRIETQGEPLEPVDLNAVVADVRNDLEIRITESDAEVEVRELPRVLGDERQLRQVFQNLLSNALEYRGDGPPRVHITAERNSSMWEVSVRDEGIGIEPDEQDRIFEVFQRLQSRDDHTGSGIGLALCERIVERHGGEIWVESEPGEGSTFSITLPAENAHDE